MGGLSRHYIANLIRFCIGSGNLCHELDRNQSGMTILLIDISYYLAELKYLDSSP